MKRLKCLTLFIATCLFGEFSFAQVSVYILDQNDCRANFRSNGFFANNFQINTPGYEVPKGGGNHTVYAFSPLWVGEVNDTLVGAAAVYEAGNAFPGPVSDDYSSGWHQTRRDVFWVTKSQIDYHQQNWNDPNYTPPMTLLDWPAMGNPTDNTSQYNAPFVDFSGTGEYNPDLGDYPKIEGDKAVFSIYNYDQNYVDNDLNNTEFPLEVQVMVYQFNSSDERLDQTTFINYRVKNRSDKTIKNFKWGAFTDIDIGAPDDDYFGSDSSRNLVYGYNGPDFDPGGFGHPGYGQNPPAQGIVLLNRNMHSVNKMTFSGTHDLDNLSNLNNLMLGRNSAGVANTNSTGQPTKFLYNEPPYENDSESMYQLGLDDDVQRNIISAEPLDFEPGEVECYHYAFVYGRNTSDHILSVEELLNNVDFIQDYYDNNIDLPCDFYNGAMSTEKFDKNTDLVAFPNPTSDKVLVKSKNKMQRINVFSSDGKLVYNAKIDNSLEENIDISSFNQGAYFFKIHFENDAQQTIKVIKTD